ncbi:MAG: radical SAM protein [Acidobacteriota bacterium]|nr:radical SAM protein [Acidobacteriota bacterium]
MKPIKYVEKGLSVTAGALFNAVQFFNKFNPNESFIPKWSDKPLQKSWQKTKPTLGWPRVTDSLCPKCVKEARTRIIENGEDPWQVIQERPGEIKATIIERDNQIWMTKDCPVHGHFEDMMAVDAKFLEHIETMYPGRDIDAHNDQHVHHHASSTIKYGRGSVLTIDLTNRCNMMCDPCFMDANQVGFVHELSWEEIKEILDNAIQVKPRRQMSVQFSGGEPTLSPYFLDAVRYARKVGYNSVQAATNGIEFAKSKEFARKAAEAGLRYVYLQFDGIGNAANSHRQVGNLFDVKLKAIDNLHSAGVEIVLVTTLVNSVNNDEVGPVIRFALDNPKKIGFISFQPVSFTGRDEDITDDRRLRQRYTLSHMAHDVKKQVGITDPHKDWFPISLMSAFADFADMAHGPDREWGQMSCGCHPNCGVGTAVMIDKETKEMRPVPDFINIPGLIKDMQKITDAARSKKFSMAMMALALLKNYNSFGSPTHFKLIDLMQKFDKTFGLSGKDYGKSDPTRTIEDVEKRRKDRWNFLFIAGMWFQDLFNYDFRRTEMCIIPYGTQEGEISFCAYNTGIGWRNIIENMHQNATVAKWYQEHGRHEIFANNHSVTLSDTAHMLKVNADDSARGREKAAVPQTAKEEQAAMRKLYMQSVLKKAGADQKLVQLGGLNSKKEEGTGAVSVSGD